MCWTCQDRSRPAISPGHIRAATQNPACQLLHMWCRQLGLQLQVLDTPLPLYDGHTGLPVPPHTDTRVERLRDTLMDSARARVEDLGEAAVEGVWGLYLEVL